MSAGDFFFNLAILALLILGFLWVLSWVLAEVLVGPGPLKRLTTWIIFFRILRFTYRIISFLVWISFLPYILILRALYRAIVRRWRYARFWIR